MNNNQKIYLGLGITFILLFLGRKPIKKAYSNMRNQDHIDSLNPRYKNNFAGFIKAAEAKGWTAQINSSWRDFLKSIQLHAEDKRNPLNSLHNYGLAIDVQFSKGNIVLGKTTPRSAWINSGLVSLAKSFGLSWGGDFANYVDEVHFYIPKYTPDQLLSMAKVQFKTNNLASIPGNKLALAA